MTEQIKVTGSGDQNIRTSLLLKNGKVVNVDGIQDVDVLIEDRLIKKIGKLSNEINDTVKVIDCSNQYIFPGGIDGSCYFQCKSNGIISSDDFHSGTEAALKGGTTTIFNSMEIDDDTASITSTYMNYKERASQMTCCDWGIQISIRKFNENVANEMKVLINEFGVTTFKLNFMDMKVSSLTDTNIFELCELCKNYGALLIAQIGNGGLHYKMSEGIWKKGIRGPEGHFYCKDYEMSAACISRLMCISQLTNCPILLTGCNDSQLLSLIASQQTGIVWTELYTAALKFDVPQLLHTTGDRSWFNVAEFVSSIGVSKDPDSKRNLKMCLANGSIDMTGSYHLKFTESQKLLGQDDFRKIPSGTPGVQERMKLLWNYGVNAGVIDVCKFVALSSTNVAQLFNIYPQKGAVKVGSDADLVIWDPYLSDICSNEVYGNIGNGGPKVVISMGEIVMEQPNKFNIHPGRGKYLKLTPKCPFIYRKVNQKEELVKQSLQSINYSTTNSKAVNDLSTDKPATDSTNDADMKSHRRPAIKCGGARNMQESTFSLSGSQVDDAKKNRPSIRTNQPPGGKSTQLW